MRVSFRVSGFSFSIRVSVLVFKFRFLVSVFKFRLSGFGFRVLVFGFGFRVLGFCFQVSAFVFSVGLWILWSCRFGLEFIVLVQGWFRPYLRLAWGLFRVGLDLFRFGSGFI